VTHARRFAFTAAAAALGTLGLAAAAPPAADDGESIKGDWSAVSLTHNGQVTADIFVKAMSATFDGKGYVNRQRDAVAVEGTYTLSPEKSPKQIDFTIETGADKGKTQLGIYEIDGDRLKLCIARAGDAERPKAMGGKTDSDGMLITLRRAKK